MRILSLLPSATEIVYALGLEESLVGVTHECDWPPAARSKPIVTASVLPQTGRPADIDRLVSDSLAGGDPIYRLNADMVRELQPDLVLTQDLCAVCAVPSGHVTDALAILGCTPEILSLDPGSLEEMFDCVQRVGMATGTKGEAADVVAALRRRLESLAAALARTDRPRTFALEWSDPPFNGGHWVPEMIERAGGKPVLGCPGTPSVRVDWDEIARVEPEVVVFMPCGYGLESAVDEAHVLLAQPALAEADRIFAVDANAYFSRPGPRLVDGVEILAGALHPEVFELPNPDGARRVR